MQKTRAKIPVYLLVLMVIASCVLRFFQLLKYTDHYGDIAVKSSIPIFIYGMFFGELILTAIYAFKIKATGNIFNFNTANKSSYFASSFLCAAFFIDFLHQCINCFNYISSASYIEYAYIIPLGLSALFSLINCFYFVTFALTAKGSNYDFRNFTLLHFSPIIWGIAKLVIIMVKIVDITINIEICLEFLLLVFMLIFFFSYISLIDKHGNDTGRTFVFSAVMTITMSVIVALPKLISLFIIGKEAFMAVNYSCITYIAIGVFALVLLNKALKPEIGE
ncbi:MAG: hypothetical protein NC397_01730 [Clostridium sp.]|nr:hypothetical protein [Clostridium sp.]